MRDYFFFIFWFISLFCGKILSEYFRDFEIFYYFSLIYVLVIVIKRLCLIF